MVEYFAMYVQYIIIIAICGLYNILIIINPIMVMTDYKYLFILFNLINPTKKLIIN